MGKYKAVLFDLGNTLIYFNSVWQDVLPSAERALYSSLVQDGLDLDSAFIDAYNSQLVEYYNDRDDEHIELTTVFVLKNVLSNFNIHNVPEKILRRALEEFHSVTQQNWIPDPEAKRALEDLKDRGFKLGLVSNAADDADVQGLVDKASIRQYFEFILTSAAFGIRKPSPRIFERALEILNVQPSQAIMVGDTLDADILGANNAGIYSIWITRWVNNPDSSGLALKIIPDSIIDAMSDLVPLIDGLIEDGN